MNPKLSVTVQVDLDGRHVSLAVTGTLTETNQQALPPLVARARTAFPAAALTVDLHQAHLPRPAALDLLAHGLQHGPCGGGSSGHPQVRITAPAHPGQDSTPRWGTGSPTGGGPRYSTTRWARPSTGVPLHRHHLDGKAR